MHVVPCMCPMSLGMPSMGTLSDLLGPSSRSDDIADESDSMDGVIDDQTIVNKLIEWNEIQWIKLRTEDWMPSKFILFY